MNYENSTPRATLGLIAAAMTVMTIGLSIVLPAKTDSTRREAGLQAASHAVTPASDEFIGSRMRVDVIGVREPSLVSVRGTAVPAKRKQQS
jgi:hypothetical protein